MKLSNANIESIGKSIAIDWKLAHKSQTWVEWNEWWTNMHEQLRGMMMFLNFTSSSFSERERTEAMMLSEEINELRNLVLKINDGWFDDV